MNKMKICSRRWTLFWLSQRFQPLIMDISIVSSILAFPFSLS